MSFLSKLFSGGVFKSIETIALEAIETDKESAEAKALMIKTLDPNGMMRRDLSQGVLRLYSLYVVVMLLLLVLEFFGFAPASQDAASIAEATTKLTDLFTPITTAFGAIVSASFGVNAFNIKKDNK